jgi:short subunit dehydrogenase-like uncharacterized protein
METSMTIAVFGASGYQGKLILAELARRGADVVLVGRDAARLSAGAAAAGLASAPCRIADADDHEAMVTAFAGCGAVVNCAGPFTPSGGAVVRAAIAAGCHYVDTSGEQLYIKQIFDTFDAAAQGNAVSVVPAATDGCALIDLTAHLLAEAAGPLSEIATIHLIGDGGGPSRGTLRTMLEMTDVIKTGGLTYQDGDWHTGIPASQATVTVPPSLVPIPLMKFPMPEVVTIPRHVRVRCVAGLAEAALGAQFAAPITPEIISSLPEGPAADARRGQQFTYLIDATAADGRHIRGTVHGADTYGTTAVIAAESVLRLTSGPVRPGVLTAAQAYDPADLLSTLAEHGIRYSVEEESRE